MHEELIARVEYLETRIAFQDHTIEQLSLELAAQQKQQEKDTYYKEHVNTVNETIARAQERIAKMLQELQTEVE